MGITERYVVLRTRLWMLLNNRIEVLNAIWPLLQLGIPSAQSVVGDQGHIVFGQPLKQDGYGFGRLSLGKVKFSLPQHDHRIVGPLDVDGGLKI